MQSPNLISMLNFGSHAYYDLIYCVSLQHFASCLSPSSEAKPNQLLICLLSMHFQNCAGNQKTLTSPWISPKSGAILEEEDEEEGGDSGAEDCGNLPAMKIITLFHCEKSLADRRQRCKGVASIQQVESMYLISSGQLSIPGRPRLHYAVSNLGNVIGPVVMQQSEWTATVKEKRDAIYTKRFRPPVGRKLECQVGEQVCVLLCLLCGWFQTFQFSQSVKSAPKL